VTGSLAKDTTRLDGYGLCWAVMQFENVPTGLVAVKASVGGKVVDTLFVNGGQAGW